ncbi:MAG: UDP-3-O-(3-hydroxymyristoyl)glucosamine N-acyltransferase [Fibrobacterota bacterium]
MSFPLQRITDAIGAALTGDPALVIEGAAPLDKAGPAHISFLANPRYAKEVAHSRAGAIILEKDLPGLTCSRLIMKNPYLGWARACALFVPDRTPFLPRDIHPTAVVHTSASLGHNVHVGPRVAIGAGVRVGDNVLLHTGVVLEENCRIGSDTEIHPNAVIHYNVTVGCRCIIWSGAVLGAYGFGYALDNDTFVRIHQLGSVVLEDEVEIGANSCVDRGAAGDTLIRRGTKIDNLVQIAHNVEIGRDCAIAGQCGISGSCKLGDRVKFAGQVGVMGHVTIGNDTYVGSKAGVSKTFPEKSTLTGYPARPLMEQRRAEASLLRLPEFLKQYRALEEKVRSLESRLNPPS